MRLPGPDRRTLLGYSLTVLISSALLLVLEIVAGRLAAPYVGVSLYTWTAIIGVILAGLSLGNWLGGVWADRGAGPTAVGLVLGAGGLWCLLGLAVLDLLGATIQGSGLTLLQASFGFSLVLFFVPAALIGVVTPLLTTLALRLDPRAGHVVGRMHALAAIGSIAGTFVAGWWLVQTIGSRAIVLGTGVALLALAAPFLRHVRKAVQFGLGLLVLSAGLVVGLRGALAGSCDDESAYFCIRVVDRSADLAFGEARGLVLDHLLHGINHRQDPGLLIAPYVQALDVLAQTRFGARYRTGLDWFFAGGGAYSLPRAVQAQSPDARITVAELDPAVTRIARERLFLAPGDMRIIHKDARLALRDEPGPFDVVVGDVFHDVAIPPHLITREFAALVGRRLGPDGLYLLNVVDAFPDPRLIKTVVKTLSTEFAHVDIWMEGVPEHERVTFIVSATNGPPLPERIDAAAGLPRTWYRATDAVMELGTPPAMLPVLTDDFAPVEGLIADLLTGAAD
jgi:predicted membrane-bound spermidine synthase